MSIDNEFVDPAMGIQSLAFERYPVVINGWTVPHLEARQNEGEVYLSLDHRFGLPINEETTPGMIIWFVANAIAIAKGYACHPVKDGWEDEDRINPPSNPRWPWVHIANAPWADGIEADADG
jgi:hypothetical protein